AMRAVLDQLHAVEGGELLATLGIVALDVPGIPVARLVDRIHPELVATAVERLAARRLVDKARDTAIGGQGHLENGVLERGLAGAEAGGGREVAADHADAERRHEAGGRDRLAVAEREVDAARRERRVDDEVALARALRQLCRNR